MQNVWCFMEKLFFGRGWEKKEIEKIIVKSFFNKDKQQKVLFDHLSFKFRGKCSSSPCHIGVPP
ncbi:hypothetical protein [Neobacillus rhizophilus]|uniref:Uncharacterized protein n=1 Tax=Neobacillus rhizophilus TaxID=2833579 RepID=A0A942UAU0_9BACI|nr:hypothetical protein [Neobacillus rhizophilus]MBS4214729.1 hypothetical protein [Neobacillus rhizophilus]